MNNAITKKIGVGAVLVALLGVIVWITIHGQGPGSGGRADAPTPAPKMDTAKLSAKWPQIVAQAAAPARGRVGTRYTLAEFGDFQCPQCGKARPVLEGLIARYPAQVNLIFLHRPFPQMHPWAVPAGQASEIAAAQGKFWPMYDVLYDHQDDLETGFYGDYAAKAGLSEAPFKAAFAAGQGMDKVKAASAFADSLGVQETPTVLLYDSKTKAMTVYVGLDGTKFANGSPQYPGVRSLAAAPPWARG